MISKVSYFAELGLLFISIVLLIYVLITTFKMKSNKLQSALIAVALILQVVAMIMAFTLHNSQISGVTDFMMQYDTTNTDLGEGTMSVNATEVQ